MSGEEREEIRATTKKDLERRLNSEWLSPRILPRVRWEEDDRYDHQIRAKVWSFIRGGPTTRLGKNSLVDNLLQKTASPFINEVATFLLPVKFKISDVLIYTGLEDPIEHLKKFWAHVDLHMIPVEVASRAFPLTLSGNALGWFKKLPPKSISNFDGFEKMFLTQFLFERVRRKPSRSLMSLNQGPDELLKDYFIYGALFQGIKKDGPLMADLAWKPPQNLHEFIDKAKEFINQEETLRALLGTEPSRASTSKMPKKKKKVDREESSTDFKQPKKLFKDYNWTPLNAPIIEVLIEVKRDPAYQKPRPILRKPPLRTANRYCVFHECNGHSTKGCISIKNTYHSLKDHIFSSQIVSKWKSKLTSKSKVCAQVSTKIKHSGK